MSEKTEGERQCDALLRASNPREMIKLASAISNAIRDAGPQGRGDVVVALVAVLMSACDMETIEAQSEGAIELIRRSVRKARARS